MNIPSLFSTLTCSVAAALGLWLVFSGFSNTSKQAELLNLQEQAQAKNTIVQKLQRDLQAQQQQIESGAQLAQQTGPAVLKDLATLQVENKNAKIAELLKKYGLEVQLNPTQNP
jgi:ABC-type uncharacterized transport system ATPase subunit